MCAERCDYRTQRFIEQLNTNNLSDVQYTDKFFVDRICDLTLEQLARYSGLDLRTLYLAWIGCIMGSDSVGLYKLLLPLALENGSIDPSEVKEMQYLIGLQIGMARMYDFFETTNRILELHGYEPVSEDNSTVTPGTPEHKAAAERIYNELHPEGYVSFSGRFRSRYERLTELLVDELYGTFYTRTKLTLAEKELVTTCALVAGDDNGFQIKHHMYGCLHVGYSLDFVSRAIASCVTIIGMPRVYSALSMLEDIEAETSSLVAESATYPRLAL
jgi:4-carboxymuconolactone decarboxylase